MKNLASSLFLTERDDDLAENGYTYDKMEADNPADGLNKPKHKGRIVTTLEKAKHIRPLVEKCITIARHAQKHLDAARQHETKANRNTTEWKQWRESDQWNQWNQAIAPALAARRRAIKLLGNVFAVEILFDTVAPRFLDRDGGYTRILRLAKPRLGDAGTRAILEFVGENDSRNEKTTAPEFDAGLDAAAATTEEETAPEEETTTEEASTEATDGEESQEKKED